MGGNEVPKGTATPLASVFPFEEARKAANRVEDAIVERQQQLAQIQRFITENTHLINLVQKLPDELSHPIMVPFGKAAFFPGRLIHTNEFLVLLGDGYYAERTSKQTTEILQRRGKALESQIEALKAMMMDLQAEASFFRVTADEAAEGLVEIREEYIEEHSARTSSESGLQKANSVDSSKADDAKVTAEDEEYARIMSRLDELEKEELEASMNDEDNDVIESGIKFSDNELDDSREKLMSQELSTNTKTLSDRNYLQSDQAEHSTVSSPDALQVENLRGQFLVKDENLLGKSSLYNTGEPNTMEKPILPQSKEKVNTVPEPKIEDSEDNIVEQTSETSAGHRKAFTGSIVEHSHRIPSNLPAHSLPSSQGPSSNPSKPVSRFKMQKGSR